MRDPELDPNALVRGTDPRIRICNIMSRNRSTEIYHIPEPSESVLQVMIQDSGLPSVLEGIIHYCFIQVLVPVGTSSVLIEV